MTIRPALLQIFIVATILLLSPIAPINAQPVADGTRPNILFVLMDNLGYGEVGAYGGGVLRGAATPRIDPLEAEGTRLTNFNVEAQCTPSRSAFLTGRFAIRSSMHSVPLPGSLDGLTQWETTTAELHAVDAFTTLARIARAPVPTDRAIDGVDQSDFLLGKSEKSSREGFPVFVADRMEAVKWQNWKIAFYDEERDWWTAPAKLGAEDL